MLCQLDGEGRDAARPALDQDCLARFQFQRILDGDDGRQSRERHCRRIDVRKPIGLLGDDGRLDRDLFGIGALLADVADAEHLVANAQIGDARSERRHGAGEIPPQDIRKLRQLV
jgi:hypothetical protein